MYTCARVCASVFSSLVHAGFVFNSVRQFDEETKDSFWLKSFEFQIVARTKVN